MKQVDWMEKLIADVKAERVGKKPTPAAAAPEPTHKFIREVGGQCCTVCGKGGSNPIHPDGDPFFASITFTPNREKADD
jgi:hypothetical protein